MRVMKLLKQLSMIMLSDSELKLNPLKQLEMLRTLKQFKLNLLYQWPLHFHNNHNKQLLRPPIYHRWPLKSLHKPCDLRMMVEQQLPQWHLPCHHLWHPPEGQRCEADLLCLKRCFELV
jgi:hypothetical protein